MNGPKDSGASTEDTSSADDSGSTDDTGSPADTTVTDSGTTVMDTGTTVTDSGTTVTDTGVVAMDTGVVAMDSGTTADGGTIGKFLIFDDTAASLAPAAVTALGGTYTLEIDAGFNTAFDAKGFDTIIVDSGYNFLPTGMNTRISSWIAGGGRIVFAYWSLHSETTLKTALGVTTVEFSTVRNVYKDTATYDLFTGIVSPLTQKTAADDLSTNGVELSVTAPSFLAGRLDSATGKGAIAITHGGKVLINGFMPFDFRATDADSDGVLDVQELYQNEVLYILSK